MMLLGIYLSRRFIGYLWIRARMVKRWLQMKKEAENSTETRIKTTASHAASPSQRRTLNVIAMENQDTLRKIASSGSA